MKNLLILFASLLLLSNCVTGPKKDVPLATSQEVMDLYNLAKKNLSKKPKTSLGQLQSIMTNHPNTDISDDAALAVGNYYYRKKDDMRALDAYLFITDGNVLQPTRTRSLLQSSKDTFH